MDPAERWRGRVALRVRQPYQTGTHSSGRAISPTRREQVMNQIADERLMTIADLSAMLGVPVDTLYGWRHRGEGPTGYRIGRHVRYRRSSVEAWLEEQADRRQSRRE
jgi:excisionase family DNA binding protein